MSSTSWLYKCEFISLIRLMDVQSMQYWKSIKKYGTKVSLYKISSTVSKKTLSLSDEWTINFVFLLSIITAITFSFRRPYPSRICYHISCVYGIVCLGETYVVLPRNSLLVVLRNFYPGRSPSGLIAKC